MHRLLVSDPAPADPAAFLDDDAGRHVPLARTLPGLLGCGRMQPAAPGSGDGAPFVLFEADFASEAAMFEALESEIGRNMAADAPCDAPAGATLVHDAVPA